MKHLLKIIVVCGLILPVPVAAWDGFDADTADLVEIITDKIPSRGDAVDIRHYDTDSVQTCLVESVLHNARTVEIVARSADGVKRTLVMEGR
jgi:hypothetical protein